MLRARLFWFCVLAVILFSLSPAAQAGYMQTVLANNPIGYWRLGETGSTTAINSGTAGTTQNGAAGTGVVLGGTAGALAGDADKAATFDGTSSGYLSVTDSSPFNFATSAPFSLEAWAKITNTAVGNQAVMSKADTNDFGYFMTLIKDGGKYQLLLQLDGATGNQDYKYGSPVNLGDGNYHYLAATYDGSGTLAGMNLYVDGSQVTTFTQSSSGTLGSIQVADPVRLGVRNATETVSLPFTGAIGRGGHLWQRLSAATISAHYLAGTTVPEPSALVLLVMGLIGLLAYAWRKRS